MSGRSVRAQPRHVTNLSNPQQLRLQSPAAHCGERLSIHQSTSLVSDRQPRLGRHPGELVGKWVDPAAGPPTCFPVPVVFVPSAKTQDKVRLQTPTRRRNEQTSAKREASRSWNFCCAYRAGYVPAPSVSGPFQINELRNASKPLAFIRTKRGIWRSRFWDGAASDHRFICSEECRRPSGWCANRMKHFPPNA